MGALERSLKQALQPTLLKQKKYASKPFLTTIVCKAAYCSFAYQQQRSYLWWTLDANRFAHAASHLQDRGLVRRVPTDNPTKRLPPFTWRLGANYREPYISTTAGSDPGSQ